ncbi:unnamed protein product [Adineta steineri]|uniref:Uncharacterized protein n=1 Tax=Adineta steineri TaxID=433720 RepID=A0A815ECB4_9BILA|nr:unnamed protein product [Adineta steineri]CAF1304928.1 unnamed protein product [Adineta steineri]CAF1351586.1 unnamed protein product [Adineta steineri]CAF3890745.1 unnamed protein product [Adineta steineri]CAF3956886.1 unnamed protein product [Adineta steineri]
MIIFYQQQNPSNLSINFTSIFITKPTISVIFRNRFESISDHVKEEVYNQCRTILERSQLLGILQHNISNGQYFFPNLITTLQDVYLLIHYPLLSNDDNKFYLQMTSSYLISKNLQKLSIQQQMRTRIVIFLSDNYTNVMYKRLELWFKSIYEPYTIITHIIRIQDSNQIPLNLMINYTKYNEDIQLDTILFFLENDYIIETDMLSDTIEFFMSHNPCFVYQPDYSDSCRLDINNDNEQINIVLGRTRLWRSIVSTSFTYACRWRTFLAFEDIIMHSSNNLKINHDIKIRAGNTVFFCVTPSYGGRLETLLLPNEINITMDDDTSVYYKDLWSIARYAFIEAQKLDSFPVKKINEQILFS